MERLSEKDKKDVLAAVSGNILEECKTPMSEHIKKDVRICDFSTGFDKLTRNHIQIAFNWFKPVADQLKLKLSKILRRDVNVNVYSVDNVTQEMLWKYVSLPAYCGKAFHGPEWESWIIPDTTMVNWLLKQPMTDRNEKAISKKEESILFKQCYKPIINSINDVLVQLLADNKKIPGTNSWLKYAGFKKITGDANTYYVKPKNYCLITMGIEPILNENDSKDAEPLCSELNIAINSRVIKVLGDTLMGMKKETTQGYVDKNIVKDIKVPIQVVIGKQELSIEELNNLSKDQIISLDTIAGTDASLVAGNKVLAYGEVVVDTQDHYGIRIINFPEEESED